MDEARQQQHEQRPIRVLLIEDNPADARLLVESLKDAGRDAFGVTHVARLSAAMESLRGGGGRPDVILLDLTLPDSAGLAGVERLRAVAPEVPVVILTGLADQDLAVRAVRQGVQDYLVKGQCEGDVAARALRYAVERRRAEAALRDGEARLAAIVDSAVDSIITIDERGTIDSVNTATEQLFGYAREELVGRNVSMLMPEPYASEHDEYVRRYLRTGHARVIGIGREVMGLRKDGTTFPTTLSVGEFRVDGRRMFTGIHHDLTNRRRLEREVLEASANEQRRIGHDLHDGLCQQILGASFGIEVLAQRLAKSTPQELPAVQKLADLLNETLTQARALAHGLNPIDLRAGGLPKALDELARRVRDVFHVECRFSAAGNTDVSDNAVATHLYRIAQEAISNAIRHGKARRVDVELTESKGQLTLSIRDDGRGLGAVAERGDGRGLHIMQYRAGLIGGTLAVRPGAKGAGTAVTCSLRISPTPPEMPAPNVREKVSPPPRSARPRRR